MNPERDYLSVIIPVHPYFAPGKKTTRQLEYEERILQCLKEQTLTLTELAAVMGYKGITAKLRTAVDTLVNAGSIKAIPAGSSVRYQAV